MEPYATSHAVLDEDARFQQEVSNVARALANAVTLARGAGWSIPVTASRIRCRSDSNRSSSWPVGAPSAAPKTRVNIR
ncbi:hypothetical protein FXB40_01090 [Bradyrhizobium rifense]|uniref:Uncharacterized protein n=1 Tax=Bradyrhizobium rifense TaxID=515499 RepID=A0A5D3KRB6_9BRAD|nr:hypothetical protein FXB40_01090 [Bradyrhizobium rifense]